MQIDPTWHQGDLVTLGVLVVSIAGYLLSRGADNRSRQEARDLQTARHIENTETLKHLMEFKRIQEDANRARDAVADNLAVMAGATVESMKGFNRRLELMENEMRDSRKGRGPDRL
jgi:hypothetical protein